jgi:hypothetical protein
MYNQKKIGMDGEVVSEDHKLLSKEKQRIEKMQERYKNWKKTSDLNFQKEGEQENTNIIKRSSNSFKNRLNKKNVMDTIKRKKHKNERVVRGKAEKNQYGSKKGQGHMSGRQVRPELKSFKQILKADVKRNIKTFGKGKPMRKSK